MNEVSIQWEFIKYKIRKYGYQPTDTEIEGLKNYERIFNNDRRS